MPEVMSLYQPAIVALLVLVIIVLVQSFLGGFLGIVRGSAQPGQPASSGKYGDVGHRALRIHHNSIENLSAFAIVVFAAVIVGASPAVVNWLAIAHVIMRVVYWAIYAAGVGANAGGPRTMAFVFAWAINLALAIVVLQAAMG